MNKSEKLKEMIEKLNKQIAYHKNEIIELEGFKLQAQVYLTIWESGLTPVHQGSTER